MNCGDQKYLEDTWLNKSSEKKSEKSEKELFRR